jgi:hypothetical protein
MCQLVNVHFAQSTSYEVSLSLILLSFTFLVCSYNLVSFCCFRFICDFFSFGVGLTRTSTMSSRL